MPNLNQNTTDLQSLLESVNALPKKVDTSGTATASDIFTGKTATVNDTRLTGTNPYNAANVEPAVTSALNALVEKGVDTSGKGLADLGSLIAAIEAGGGGAETGSITPDTYTNTVELGVNIPDDNFFFCLMNESSMLESIGNSYIRSVFFTVVDGTVSGFCTGSGTTYSVISDLQYGATTVTFNRTSKSISFSTKGGSQPIYLYGSFTYRWFIGGLA